MTWGMAHLFVKERFIFIKKKMRSRLKIEKKLKQMSYCIDMIHVKYNFLAKLSLQLVSLEPITDYQYKGLVNNR